MRSIIGVGDFSVGFESHVSTAHVLQETDPSGSPGKRKLLASCHLFSVSFNKRLYTLNDSLIQGGAVFGSPARIPS